MSQTELLKGHTETIILAALAEEPKHGYAISEHLKLETDHAFTFSPGMLYPLLHAMENKKLIRATWSKSAAGPKRKVYYITRKGKRVLTIKTVEWKKFSALINNLIN